MTNETMRAASNAWQKNMADIADPPLTQGEKVLTELAYQAAWNARNFEIERLRDCLQWFADRQDTIQAKFNLHGPADTATAMRRNFARCQEALNPAQESEK